MATFSFEEGLSPDAGGDKFVPASRTKIKQESAVPDPTDILPANSTKQGRLPKDPSIQEAIVNAAKEFNVPPEFALALADQESGYNVNAHNDEFGADGPFQFTPDSAKLHGLEYGKDTRDVTKSARAAMKDFAAQMAVGGTDWAIKHHFAGPNIKGHGPKTRQYLADVTKRAQDIRRLLENPDAPVSTASVKKAGPKTFSFEEGYGETLASTPPVREQKAPIQAGFIDHAVSFLGNSSEAIQDAGKRTFDFVWQRLKDGPDEYLGKKRIGVRRSEQEVEDQIKKEQALPWWKQRSVADHMDPDYWSKRRAQLKAEVIPALQTDPGTDAVNKRRAEAERAKHTEVDPDAPWYNRIAQAFGNPFDAFLNESLPVNALKALSNAPERVTENFWKARQVAMQENIVAHPEQFPEVAVQAAQQAINARKEKQEPGVREMWNDLKSAAASDPAKFVGTLGRAFMADPEMVMAPGGVGLKVVADAKKAATGASVAGKVAQTADKIIDAGTTGAALNMGMEAASKTAKNEEITGSDMGFTAAVGFGLSGALGPLFGRKGSAAREKIKSGDINSVDLDNIIKEAAKESVATEGIVNSHNPISATVKHQIEEATGIKFESEADLKAHLQAVRKEWRELFKERDLHGQFQRALAEERTLRTQQLADDAAAKQAGDAKDASVESAYVARREEIRNQYESDWQEALAARDRAALTRDHSEAIHENTLRDATAKLDEQEIIDAAFQGSPQVREAMLRSAQRDAKLRVPKWQRGEIDPKLVARLGIGSLFAGTAFAIAPEGEKTGAAFAAGLAGLLIPGGGRVLDRMRQSGIVSSEGDIIGLLVQKGKLKPDVDAQQVRLAEAETIGRAKQGDQGSYKKLYEDNFPRIKRFAKQYVREAGPKLGIDAEDIAQNTFIQAFRNLDKFNGTSGFYTWLYAIAKNEGLQAIREAQNLKGGGQFKITSMHSPSGADAPGDLGAGHLEGGNSAIKGEVENAAADIDTPEGIAIREEVKQQLTAAIGKLPEKQREVFLLNRVEQYTAQEIAEMKGRPIGSILSDIKRAQDAVTTALEKGYGAKKIVATPETSANVSAELPKRGRGRPRLQRGEVDPKLLAKITGVAGTASLAAFLVDNEDGKRSKATAAIGGAALGLLLFGGGGRGLRSAVSMIDDAAGVASTRLLNASPKIFRRAQNAERRILENTHHHITEVDQFLVRLNKLSKEGQQVVTRALLTGHSAVITRVIGAIADKELTAGYAKVRAVLDSIGDKLVQLNRFKRGDVEYFPRIVKDRDGLFKAIGKKDSDSLKDLLTKANAESIKKNGRPLSQIEESSLINQALFVDKRANQPGWSKNRGIEEITPELLQYYATPAESIHTYIRSAVQDIEKAKFFGRYAKNMPKGQFEFLDTDRSINNMLAEEIKSGELTHEQANEIADILKARFGKGEVSEVELIRNIKNVGNIGLLGNLWSASSQLADVALQVHVQSLTSTLRSVTKQLTGRSIISVKDLGLVDHISEEFAGQLRTTRWFNNFAKVSLFSGMDKFGKNTALNAALIRAKGLAASDSGQLKLANKYHDMFGDDFQKLVSELKAGKVTDLTREYAWLELSRTQPISRLEMPVAYLNNPNLRTFWWLKSFTVKQFDLLRRDAYNEIKKGNVGKGLKNLVSAGVAMGVGGAGTQIVKDWMLGRDPKLDLGEVPLNMLRNLGFSQYILDHMTGVSKEEAAAAREAGDTRARAQRAAPLEALADIVAPPYKMFQDIITGNPKAARYLVPIVGPYVAERLKTAEAERKQIEKETQ